MRSFRRVCVYCGSSGEVSDRFKQAATDMGEHLASRGIGVVYGGGSVGTMGILADAALAAGGQVYGVIPEKLMALELGHDRLTELFVVDGMHARKMMMAQLSDAFVALPGGIGTLEELIEMSTWRQLGRHTKPIAVANIEGFWNPLLDLLDHMRTQEFIRAHMEVHLDVVNRPEDILPTLQERVKTITGV